MSAVLATERLILRTWRDADRQPFAAMNADPDVMRYFPSTLSRDDSDRQIDRIVDRTTSRGFGFWAVEIPGVTPFAGFIGLSVPAFEAPFMPYVEIGWRLAGAYWGQGYATEGARASLRFGFETLGVAEIVAFTAVGNAPSRRVMDRIDAQFRSNRLQGPDGLRIEHAKDFPTYLGVVVAHRPSPREGEQTMQATTAPSNCRIVMNLSEMRRRLFRTRMQHDRRRCHVLNRASFRGVPGVP